MYLAQYDQLTGLVNRTLFRDRLTQAMARCKRTAQSIGLMLLDLDRFKAVNDTMGHDAGDNLLKAVSDRLRRCVREVDTVARMGGDEFTIILEGVTSRQDVTVVAQRIAQSISEPFTLGDQQVSIGVSIGITMFPQNDQTIDTLLKHADAAMYRAKQHGGNAFQFYLPDPTQSSIATLSESTRT
jgi:diguanylate cyclase (GGDEF)-like protein